MGLIGEIMKKLLLIAGLAILVVGVATCTLVSNPKKPVALAVPTKNHESEAPGKAGVHWRLVAEQDYDGQPIQRVPITKTFYTTSEDCIKIGSALPGPPRGDGQHVDYLVRCLPYNSGEDTEAKTPI